MIDCPYRKPCWLWRKIENFVLRHVLSPYTRWGLGRIIVGDAKMPWADHVARKFFGYEKKEAES